MSTDKTFFTKIFGDDMGEFLQFFVGFGVLMAMFIGGPLLMTKYFSSSNSKDKEYKELVTGSRETTQDIYIQIHRYDSLTQVIDKKIDNEFKKEKDFIRKKREILIELNKNFDSVYLTPQQLDILASVGDEKNDITFKEWIASSNQWYNIGVSIIISFIFYILGKRNGKTL